MHTIFYSYLFWQWHFFTPTTLIPSHPPVPLISTFFIFNPSIITMSSFCRLLSTTTRYFPIFQKTISQSGSIQSITAINVNNARSLSLINSTLLCNNNNNKPDATGTDNELKSSESRDIDRTKIIPVEQSLRYLASEAYKQTYGTKFVWEQYRRNHKGPFAPRKTRKTCVRKGVISTGNPCPICRDEYLVLDHRNLQLLRQFISPQTGEVRLKFTFIFFSIIIDFDSRRFWATRKRDCARKSINNWSLPSNGQWTWAWSHSRFHFDGTITPNITTRPHCDNCKFRVHVVLLL